ncbi:hypothetical protein ACP70R_015624 [Stipagrostis hirtigluma subsp. patula]
MKRLKTLDSFFKPVDSSAENPNVAAAQDVDRTDVQVPNENMAPPLDADQERIVATAFERDLGKRDQIIDLHSDKKVEARRFYIFEETNWEVRINAFTVKGFQNWKKVNDGTECALLKHMGDASSAHNYSVRCMTNFKNRLAQIDTQMVKQNDKKLAGARLRLTTTADAIRWLTFQCCPFTGHDESAESLNRGNFLEMIKLLASYNEDVKAVVLENAPKNAKYTSSDVQKEILSIYAQRVQQSIREEIGNSKFCIMVDEARDESKKEQMAIVVRFVNNEGLIKERFLDLIHVKETAALTLKDSICAVLSASREAEEVHNFFQHANFIINIVSASPKLNDELLANQAEEITREIELGDLDTGRGANQLGSLQRPGDTRWSSHHKSIQSLKKMFAATISVPRSVANDRLATK